MTYCKFFHIGLECDGLRTLGVTEHKQTLAIYYRQRVDMFAVHCG